MIEFDQNPKKNEEINRYAQLIKRGQHSDKLLFVLLDEIAEIIASKNNQTREEVKEMLYKKAGEKMVNSITYMGGLRED